MQIVSNRKEIREMDAVELDAFMQEISDRNEWQVSEEDESLFNESFLQYKQLTGEHWGIINKKKSIQL